MIMWKRALSRQPKVSGLEADWTAASESMWEYEVAQQGTLQPCLETDCWANRMNGGDTKVQDTAISRS
jgi:hypothetical protein